MPDTEIAAIRALLTGRPRPSGAAERRQRLDDFGRNLGAPEHARLEPVDINGVPAEWSTTPEADAARAVLYLHGGGYMAGSIESHRYVAVEIGRAARVRTLALGYRRAPEHPYPAQLEDALAAWQYLRDQGLRRGASRSAATAPEPTSRWPCCWRSARAASRCPAAAGWSRHGPI